MAGPGPDETGRRFCENAAIKACFWSGRLGGLAAASDGGLTVPALGEQWDALHTARAAGLGADDQARARHLLWLARNLVGDQRAAYWTEGLALARDGRPLASWQAEDTQAVLLERLDLKKLRPGFWAASLCYLPDRGITLAELGDEGLAEADPTWSRLRDQVREFVLSGQADLERA